MARRRGPQSNLLDLRPVRLVAHQVEGERAVVLVPRFRARWMQWYLRRLRNPCYRLRLDEVGTAVWLRCDGTHTVCAIGDSLREQFGRSIEPVWDRLAMFLREMRAGKLIELQG